MNETSLSLLEHLRSSPEAESWERLTQLYSPLIRTWLRKYDVQDSDADDLIQEVLLAISKDLCNFEHGGQTGAFRGWLKAILVNRLRNFWRSRDRRPQAPGDSGIHERLAQLEDPASAMSQIWNREHDQYVLRQMLSLAEPHFEATTWSAFSRVALEGAKPDIVAKELGISRNAVIVAKCRVLSRLRQESNGLVESSFNFFANG
ncbi:MAG: sigma-70 family RNA polymerase sigma factor [Planctomycetota bacterium]